jgi:hypothetical protein
MTNLEYQGDYNGLVKNLTYWRTKEKYNTSFMGQNLIVYEDLP